jgi:hypothetical protein
MIDISVTLELILLEYIYFFMVVQYIDLLLVCLKNDIIAISVVLTVCSAQYLYCGISTRSSFGGVC